MIVPTMSERNPRQRRKDDREEAGRVVLGLERGHWPTGELKLVLYISVNSVVTVTAGAALWW